MSTRGGKRPGAGRPKGSRNRKTLDQQNMILRAQGAASLAVDVLTEIAEHGESETARIAAAVHLLDRAYGKPVKMEIVVEKPVDRLAQLLQEINQSGRGRYPIVEDVSKVEDDGDLWRPPAATPKKTSEPS